MKNKQCVIIGGTFAPLTNAHIEMGIQAKKKFPKADIIYVPSNLEFISDWKSTTDKFFFNNDIRIRFIKSILIEYGFYMSFVEIDKIADGSTIDLINYFKFRCNYDDIILAIGYDKLDEIENWNKYKDILNSVHLLVFSRNNENRNIKYDHTLIELDSKFQNISSSLVRRAYYDRDYDSLVHLVPDYVYGYLQDNEYPSFNAAKVKDDIVLWIRDFFDKNSDNGNAIVGISGGKDSSIVTALCVEALGKDRVLGVLMPNKEQDDIAVARKLVDYLGIDSIEINIGDTVQSVLDGIRYGIYNNTQQGADSLFISIQTMINLPARIRMATLYAVSQSSNGRVANTCNLSEDFVGYSTRYGDNAGDFSPLSNLVVDEVKQIGYELNLPSEFIEKIPSDGLCGDTDEENLGFSYEILDKYIRTGICDDIEIKDKIDRLHTMNKFKLQPIPKFTLN